MALARRVGMVRPGFSIGRSSGRALMFMGRPMAPSAATPADSSKLSARGRFAASVTSRQAWVSRRIAAIRARMRGIQRNVDFSGLQAGEDGAHHRRAGVEQEGDRGLALTALPQNRVSDAVGSTVECAVSQLLRGGPDGCPVRDIGRPPPQSTPEPMSRSGSPRCRSLMVD